MPKSDAVITGSCLCGAIRYEADAIKPSMAHCHCSMCRKFSGAAFASYAVADASDFRWKQGAELLRTYTAPNGTQRQFCHQCGANMVFKSSQEESLVIEFSLGTLDSALPGKPDAHIYVASKASWYEIHDTLPQHAHGRPAKAL